MKRVKFYTKCHDCIKGKDFAKEVQGYTDGTFFYWRMYNVWYAVHPSTGLSHCSGYTLKETAAIANTADNVTALIKHLEERGAQLIKTFDALLKNAGLQDYNWQEIASVKRINK